MREINERRPPDMETAAATSFDLATILQAETAESRIIEERRRLEACRAFRRQWLQALGLHEPERLRGDALRRVVQFGAVVEAAARRRAA